MKVVSALLLLCCFGFGLAASETLYEYLFVSKQFPQTLSKTVRIAEKEMERIKVLVKAVTGLAVFLPTDNAWNERPGYLEALINEKEGNARYDTLVAVAAEVPLQKSSTWEDLKKFADSNGGVIDSAYGVPYFVMENNQFCIANWVKGDYVPGECGSVVGVPIKLSDCVVYQIDTLIVPADLESAIENLVHVEDESLLNVGGESVISGSVGSEEVKSGSRRI